MQSMRNKVIFTLLKKDLLLEFRQQYTFFGILLYIASTTFVIYLTMGQPEDHVWNGLFWVTLLFICINTVARSFLQEGKGRMLYFYTIASPVHFIFSKLIYNSLLMCLMSGLSLLLFILLLGNPLQHGILFFGISCLGGISLSLVFSFLAAIASKAQQPSAIMAILGFPLIIPQLMLLMKIANIAFSDVVQNGLFQLVWMLIGFNIMIIALAYILFPFLWKE
ncbi:MAG: cytochrome C biogenesis protein [Chitinophagia bacterium]|jgi:heme exporter protein B|nr:cytochrome C biogenesis protein [Chitinophagia bacterium]